MADISEWSTIRFSVWLLRGKDTVILSVEEVVIAFDVVVVVVVVIPSILPSIFDNVLFVGAGVVKSGKASSKK